MRFLALIALLLIGATAQAATIEIGTPSYIRPGPDGQLYYWPADERAPPRVAYPGMENNARDINVPTSKGRLPVTLNQKTPVNLNKLGGPIVNLAKRAGPLGLGLTAAGLLCEYEYICPADDGSNTWEKVHEPVHTDQYPLETPGLVSYFCCSAEMREPAHRQPTPQAVCEYANTHFPPPANMGIYVYRPGGYFGYGGCAFSGAANPNIIVQDIDSTIGCATGYYHYEAKCRKIGGDDPQRLPVTPLEWDNAPNNPGLHTPDVIPDLIEGGEPIPVETPEIEPKTVPGPGGSTTETIRNGQGQPIGTKTTDTTVTVTPSGPTTVNVTETTTITETNITNNTTTTTVQETTLPNNEDQSEKPKEDQDIEIDNVQDRDMETYEIPDTFDHESWGGGTCPGDQAISVLGKSITVPIHHICDGLTMLRPVVLIIAFLAAAYIIAGAIRQ